LNDRALKLGEDTKHLKHGLATRRCRVDAMLMQEQTDAGGMDFREETKQALKASAQTVDRPSHHHVEIAPGRSFVKGIEFRPLVFALGTGNAVMFVDAHDLPAGSLGNLAQLTLLIGCGLIERRNPEIKDCTLHDFPHVDKAREVFAARSSTGHVSTLYPQNPTPDEGSYFKAERN
jgi:hypothetical protein